MATTIYTEEDLTAMSKEAEAVGDLLNAIDRLLDNEAKSQVITRQKASHVDFAIKTEFTKTMTRHASLSLMKILSSYHDWAERTYLLCMKNAGQLQKGKLRAHVIEARDMVATITKILPMAAD